MPVSYLAPGEKPYNMTITPDESARVERLYRLL
jgi:hypothetical protein